MGKQNVEKRKQEFTKQSFSKRLRSMLKVDARRMFLTSRFYIFLLCCFAMPVLILVMTTMVSGSTVVDPSTGVETTMESFSNAWQVIASPAGDGAAMNMDMTAMCNINLVYFLTGVLVCLFVSDDFRSGYSKNLFTVRAQKGDYVASKTILCFIAGALMLLAFFAGAILGGILAGLPFTLGAAGMFGVMMCMLAKIFLMGVFVAIFLAMSVIAKHRAWMSILLSLFGGMLLFMMIPMMTPLDSGMMNVFLCLAGGSIFATGIGAVSNGILKRTNLV